jgi:fatty acid-binding protein DegV
VVDLALKKIETAESLEMESKTVPSQADKQHVSLAVVHSNAHEIATRVADKLAQHTGQKVEMVMNASPVLGAHAGPGAVAVAILKRNS